MHLSCINQFIYSSEGSAGTQSTGGGGYNEVTQQRESLHNPTYLGLICLVKCAYVGGWRKQSYLV